MDSVYYTDSIVDEILCFKRLPQFFHTVFGNQEEEGDEDAGVREAKAEEIFIVYQSSAQEMSYSRARKNSETHKRTQ